MSANIVADARTQAEQIKNRAQNEIEIERRRAFEGMKGELSGLQWILLLRSSNVK